MFFLLVSTAKVQSSVFDVTSAAYGGKPNSDITQALANAWRDACASTWPAKVVIPQGTYYTRGAILQGPCKAPIDVQVQGNFKAPLDSKYLTKQDSWVGFQYVDRLTLYGGGTFDGQNNCYKNKYCKTTQAVVSSLDQSLLLFISWILSYNL